MKFNQLTIKQKLIMAMIFAVLASTALVGILSQQQARQEVEHSRLRSELPATLKQVRNQIDKEVSVLQSAAQQLVTNHRIAELSTPGSRPCRKTQIT